MSICLQICKCCAEKPLYFSSGQLLQTTICNNVQQRSAAIFLMPGLSAVFSKAMLILALWLVEKRGLSQVPVQLLI